jgi:hypothetical protein
MVAWRRDVSDRHTYKVYPMISREDAMSRKPVFFFLAVLAITALACETLNVRLPATNVRTGPTETIDINIDKPSGDVATLNLNFGAGVLKVAGGALDGLVTGTASYNVPELKPEITTSGNTVTVQTGRLEINSLPNFGRELKNDWDLKLGTSPMDLAIKAGAYQGNYDLGGLSLKSLEVKDGAAEVTLDFAHANLVEMSRLTYGTGASNVKLMNLGNANFATMDFSGGAGDYTLDFGGDLKRDATITVHSGISHLVIVVPSGVAANMSLKGGLSNVRTNGNWQGSGGQYSQTGTGPTLTFQVDMGAGDLELKN